MKLIKEREFRWYVDISKDEHLAVIGYPVDGQIGVPLCSGHAKPYLLYEEVVPDEEADELREANYCWMCE